MWRKTNRPDKCECSFDGRVKVGVGRLRGLLTALKNTQSPLTFRLGQTVTWTGPIKVTDAVQDQSVRPRTHHKD